MQIRKKDFSGEWENGEFDSLAILEWNEVCLNIGKWLK